MKEINEEMDYIYDWTTGTDLKKRVNKKAEKTSENSSEENEKNSEKDLESNNHDDQIDKIATRQINRNDTHEISRERGGEDKVESVCCTM